MRLHDLLDRVASTDQPVSRLDAVHLYAGGQRHRRRVRLVRGAGAFGATALAVVVVLVISTIAGAPRKESEPPAQKDVENTFTVHRVGAYDKEHLWVYGEVSPGGGYQVASTDDGGRTWTPHNRPDPADRFMVRDNIGLLQSVDGKPGVSAFPTGLEALTVRYTKDSWRTRDSATLSSATVADASPDALVLCARTRPWPDAICSVSVFEPATNRYSPLATQPTLNTNQAVRAPDGSIWALGLDPASKRPAVASTTDSGRTWSTHVFAELAPLMYETAGMIGTLDFARNGTILLSTLAGGGLEALQLLRFNGGDWQRLPDVAYVSDVGTWLTDDGANVLLDIEPPPPLPTAPVSEPAVDPSAPVSPRPFISPGPPATKVRGVRVCPLGSGEYRNISPPAGLPTDQALIRVVALPGGGRVGWNWHGIWSSPDGMTWQEIPRPPR